MHPLCPVNFIYRHILRQIVVPWYICTRKHKSIQGAMLYNKEKFQRIFIKRKQIMFIIVEYYVAMKINSLNQPVSEKKKKMNKASYKRIHSILHEN